MLTQCICRVARRCNEDTVVNGIPTKEGCLVAIPQYYLHFRDDFWTDPERFNPERLGLCITHTHTYGHMHVGDTLNIISVTHTYTHKRIHTSPPPPPPPPPPGAPGKALSCQAEQEDRSRLALPVCQLHAVLWHHLAVTAQGTQTVQMVTDDYHVTVTVSCTGDKHNHLHC